MVIFFSKYKSHLREKSRDCIHFAFAFACGSSEAEQPGILQEYESILKRKRRDIRMQLRNRNVLEAKDMSAAQERKTTGNQITIPSLYQYFKTFPKDVVQSISPYFADMASRDRSTWKQVEVEVVSIYFFFYVKAVSVTYSIALFTTATSL